MGLYLTLIYHPDEVDEYEDKKYVFAGQAPRARSDSGPAPGGAELVAGFFQKSIFWGWHFFLLFLFSMRSNVRCCVYTLPCSYTVPDVAF